MTRRIVVLETADADIDEHLVYLETNNPPAALRFVDDLQATLDRLAQWPLSAPQQRYAGSPIVTSLHVCPVSQVFRRYLIFYRHDETAITIVRVLHGSRDIPTLLLEPDTPPSWQ